MAEWVIDLLREHGYAGIVLLMLAENLFPPLPSELIMPFAGFMAATGERDFAGVVAAGTLGSLLGALPWYAAGRLLGRERVLALAERHGRWMTVSRAELERGERWFRRHGPMVLVLGRLVPGLRTLVALPAGLVAMSPWTFAAWTVLGSALWCTLLALAGHALGQAYGRVADWMNPVSTLVLVGVVAGYVVRVLRGREGSS